VEGARSRHEVRPGAGFAFESGSCLHRFPSFDHKAGDPVENDIDLTAEDRLVRRSAAGPDLSVDLALIVSGEYHAERSAQYPTRHGCRPVDNMRGALPPPRIAEPVE